MCRFILTAMAALPMLAQTPAAGNPQNGKKIFETYGCYQCHGREAQGSVSFLENAARRWK